MNRVIYVADVSGNASQPRGKTHARLLLPPDFKELLLTRVMCVSTRRAVGWLRRYRAEHDDQTSEADANALVVVDRLLAVKPNNLPIIFRYCFSVNAKVVAEQMRCSIDRVYYVLNAFGGLLRPTARG